MHRFLLIGATLLLAPAAQAAILWQSTLSGAGGPVYFDDFLAVPSVTTTGSTWIGISGGTITSAEWRVEGEFSKYWWELISEDDEGNQDIYLNGNDYIYLNGCTVTPGAPSCGFAGNFLSQLHNNKVRVDFTAPQSFDHCFPFNGVFNVDCAAFFTLYGAGFYIAAEGPGDITLTISDTRIPGAIPEPASWAMLIAGFGLTGAALRRRRYAASRA
jgi:hypothetical protein